MLLEYKPSLGATILDMVLNTYLSLDLLPKFVEDNGIDNLNLVAGGDEVYIYDTDFVSNEFMSIEVLRNSLKFTTGSYTIPNALLTDEDYLLTESDEIFSTGDNYLITI